MKPPRDLSNLQGDREKVFNAAILLCLRNIIPKDVMDDTTLLEAGRGLFEDGMIELVDTGDGISMRLACTPAEMAAYLAGPH